MSGHQVRSHFNIFSMLHLVRITEPLPQPPPSPTDPSGAFMGFGKSHPRFRSHIPSQQFPAEPDRYVLYVNYCCPWAHRAIIARALKGLQDIIQLVEVDSRDPTHGWYFSGRTGPVCDPLYGGRWLKELYLKADPSYSGRITVPMLFDKKQGI